LKQIRPLSPGIEFFYAASTNGSNTRELEKRTHEILREHRIGGEMFSVDGKTAVSAVIQAAAELGFSLRERGETDHEDATDKAVIYLRLSRPGTHSALKVAAKDDLRSVSTLIEKILDEWLCEHGYLSAAPKPKTKTIKS